MFDRVLNMPLVSIRSNYAGFGVNITKDGRKVKLDKTRISLEISLEICCLISREKCPRNCKTVYIFCDFFADGQFSQIKNG